MRTDTPFSYQFAAQANRSYLVEVDQGGLDLKVTITAPDSTETTFNSPLLRDESEIILLEPDEADTFTITLLSTEYSGAVAGSAIQVTEVVPSNEAEGESLAGLRLVSQASAANHQGTMEGWQSALQAYDRAVVHFTNADDQANLARTLFSMAVIEYWQMGKWDRSAELAARAAEIYRQEGEPRLAANAIHLQAAAIIEKAGDVEKSEAGGLAPEASALFDEALSLFDRALVKQRELDNPFDAALVTNNIGITYYYMGSWNNAAINFRGAADQFKQLGEWGFELQALSNGNAIDVGLGNLVKGIASSRRILELIPPNKQKRFKADQLDNLGASLLIFGQLDEALQSFSEAQAIHQEIDDVKGQGRSLAGIGTTYYTIGEYDLALEILEAALTARQKANDGRGQVAVLKFIGNIHRQNGDYSLAAEAHSDALRLVTSPIDRAGARIYLAKDFVAAGSPDRALEMLDNARRDARDIDNRKLLADLSRVSGDAWLKAGDYSRSSVAYEQAAGIYQGLGLGAERSQAVFGQAKTARALDQKSQALEYAELAVSSVENLRQQLIAPELRKFFLASRQQYYAFLIDTLMSLHNESVDTSDEYMRQALSISERSRARALVDLVNESAISPEFPGSIGLLEKQNLLYQQMAENRHRLNKLLDKSGSEQQIFAARQALADIENELNLLQIGIRQQNPGYANLVDPTILEADLIQDLLDSDSVLLQYFLGDERSYVWSVTSDSIEAWSLPGRGAIEATARRLYDLLKVPAYSSEARAELKAGLTELSSQLIGPVGPFDKNRIIVAADGVLNYLPFSVLDGITRANTSKALLSGHEFVYLPSMSVLAAQDENRHERVAPQKEIAIFADPVFDRDDNRLQTAAIGGASTGDGGPKEISPDAATLRLTRLPATAHEAGEIAGLTDPENSYLALGFDASRESVMTLNLENYRVVHFATHGLIDSRYPALSALAFSQFDERGEPLNGFLRLHDFYNLDLDADLVTMSACSTALGREISGEGLTGLTQGLMYSGSKTVLASLWQVPDRATAELMKYFYRNLLDKKQKPAEALRNAQLELSSTTRWHSPYFWGAFVLQGDWR